MNEEVRVNAVMVEDKHGQLATVGDRAIMALTEMGVIRKCSTSMWLYHSELSHDAIDALIDELGLAECGFCRGDKPTHQIPVDPAKLGKVHGAAATASRPILLCAECALLYQTGDRALLAERLLEHSVQLNRRLDRRTFDQRGEDKIREDLRPAIEQATDETFRAAIGQPYELPPRDSGEGIVIIGGS